jgi:hypothetical protein
MSFTNFSTSILNYGPSLPTGQVPDGSMFHLTSGATGLYVYNFSSDSNTSLIGDQVGQGWKLLASTGLINADTFGGQLPSYYQVSDGDLTAISNLNGVGFAVRLGTDSWATRSFVAGSGVTLSNTNGSTDITIGVNTSAISLNSLSGILAVTSGGTGNNVAVAGAVAYGTGSSIAYTSVGSAGQFLQSNGASAPTWGTSSVTIGTTNIPLGSSATVIGGLAQVTSTTFVGALSGKASTAGIADSANLVLWTNVSGRPTALSSFTNDVGYITLATANATYSLLSHNHSLNTLSNVSIAAAQSNDLLTWNGVNWVNSPTAAKASTLAQSGVGTGMIFNWSGQVGQPSWLWGGNDGVNMYVYNPSNFSVANTSSISNAVGNSYSWSASQAFNAGLSASAISSSTTITAGTTIQGNAISSSTTITAGTTIQGNAISSSTTITAGTTITASSTIQGNGLTSRDSTSSHGYINVTPGDATHSGFIEFMAVAFLGRVGYIGYSNSTTGADIGTINYVAGSHAFSGALTATGAVQWNSTLGVTGTTTLAALTVNGAGTFNSTVSTGALSVTGTITASGNITAYFSDGRLKTNVRSIPNALSKVLQLGGYVYDWDLEKCASIGFKPERDTEHGLIAQEVQLVVPEAVAPAPGNNEYLTVRYEKLVSLLMAAMGEQQKQIEDLQSQVAWLKNVLEGKA